MKRNATTAKKTETAPEPKSYLKEYEGYCYRFIERRKGSKVFSIYDRETGEMVGRYDMRFKKFFFTTTGKAFELSFRRMYDLKECVYQLQAKKA